jgi:hypothetical protein
MNLCYLLNGRCDGPTADVGKEFGSESEILVQGQEGDALQPVEK